jgi:hypothetical protein
MESVGRKLVARPPVLSARSRQQRCRAILQQIGLFCRHLPFSFAYAKHAFNCPSRARKYCTFGVRNAARDRARRDGNRGKFTLRSPPVRPSEASATVPGDERQQTAGWYRRSLCAGFESNISDLGGETLQCRQAPSSNVPMS